MIWSLLWTIQIYLNGDIIFYTKHTWVRGSMRISLNPLYLGLARALACRKCLDKYLLLSICYYSLLGVRTTECLVQAPGATRTELTACVLLSLRTWSPLLVLWFTAVFPVPDMLQLLSKYLWSEWMSERVKGAAVRVLRLRYTHLWGSTRLLER